MRVRIYPASYVLRNIDNETEGQGLLYKEEYLSVAKDRVAAGEREAVRRASANQQ